MELIECIERCIAILKEMGNQTALIEWLQFNIDRIHDESITKEGSDEEM